MKKVSVLALILAFAPAVFAQNTGLNPAETKKADAYYHFSMARVLDEMEQWDRSIAEYQEALKLTPNDPVIYTAMARTYLNFNKAEEAAAAAEMAIKIYPDSLGAHRLLADMQINILSRRPPPRTEVIEAALDKAIQEYEEIIRIDQTKRDDFIMLGRLYQINNAPEKAVAIYKKYLGSEPGSEEGVMALANLYLESNNNADAIEVLEAFLQNQPDMDKALELLGDAYSNVGDTTRAADAYKRAFAINDDADLRDKYAEALYQDNQLEEAAKIYNEILSEDQRNADAMIKLAQIYRRQMKYSDARAILDRAGAGNRNNISVRFNLALVDRDEGNFEAAITSLKSILKDTEKTSYGPQERQSRSLFLTHIGLLNSLLIRYDEAIQAFTDVRNLSDGQDEKSRIDTLIVDTYKASKNLDKAMTYLQSALKDFPDNRALQMAYAQLVAEQGRPDEGIRTLLDLSKGADPDLELLSAIAGIYERDGRFGEAQTVLDRAKTRFPDDKEVHFLQGALYERQKKFVEAEQAFRKALEFDRNDPSVLNYLGYMLADRDSKLDEALSMIQKAVDSDPINGAFLDSLGWVYFKLNRMDLAEQYLKRAVTFAASNATMHDHLGDLYYKLGRFSEAQASWTQGLQYADDPEEAAQIRQKLDQVRNRTANR